LNSVENPLRPRDWLLLTATSLLTIVCMFGIAELACRQLWSEFYPDNCVTSRGNRPNCWERVKNAEGLAYEYRFNECGYRSPGSCLRKPKGAMRIVTLGTSIAMGLFVSQADMFASQAAAELSKSLGLPVDAQNMANMSLTLEKIPPQIPAALRMEPDAIILIVGPYDLGELTAPVPVTAPATAHAVDPSPIRQLWYRGVAKVRWLTRQTRVGLMAQHALLRNEAYFFNAYNKFRDPGDALADPPSASLMSSYARLDEVLGEIRKNIGTYETPVFILPFPSRIIAGMLSEKIHFPGTDPEAFQRQLTTLADRHGMVVVDSDAALRAAPHSEQFYYPVDSHPSPECHIVLGHALARRLAMYFESVRNAPPQSRISANRS
jgi:hypothetical protein